MSRGLRNGVGAAVAVVLLAGCTSGSSCGDRDTGGCSDETGSVSARAEDGTQRWRTAVDDNVAGPVFVTAGFVVVPGCEAVHVLDRGSGRVLLETSTIEDAVGIVDGLVVGRTGDDVAGVRVDGQPGGSRWSSTSGSGEDRPTGIAVLAHGVATSDDDRVTIYQSDAGGSLPTQLPGEVDGDLAVLDDRVLAATRDGSVYLVTPGAGLRRVLVSDVVDSRVATRFQPVGDRVLVSSVVAGGAGTALLDTDGTVLWRVDGQVLPDTVFSPDARVAPVATGAGGDGFSPGPTTGAVDLETGRVRWSMPTPPAGDRAVVTRDVVAARQEQESGGGWVVRGRDARTGRVRWSHGEAGVGAAAGGEVLVQSSDGGSRTLDAVGSRSGDVAWSTPVEQSEPSAVEEGAGGTLVVDLPPRRYVMCG